LLPLWQFNPIKHSGRAVVLPIGCTVANTARILVQDVADVFTVS